VNFDHMPDHRLPSLHGLRAFDAFARAGSMVRAGAELGVTHGAVSRQIKALERQLGAQLLVGPRHALTLTPAGRRLAQAVAEGFATIRGGLPGGHDDDEIVLSAPATFAMKWLIPRLGGLALRVRLVEDDGPVDFGRRAVHAAIRLHAGAAPDGARVTPFLGHAFGPVLAPRLLAACDGNRHRALRSPRLASETFPDGWDRWAAATDADLPGLGDVRMFEHNAYMLEAAAAGLGVAVTAHAFAQADIDAGRLAAPWGFQRLPTRFCLLRPPLVRSARLEQLARWLVAEGRRAPPPIDPIP